MSSNTCNLYTKFFKRLIDIFLSAIALVLLSPVFLIIAILIKLTSRGPVFFKQERMGQNFKKFKIYKFRTMIADAPSKGPAVTGAGDPRITWIGAILRKSKLDELPQLINVLKGDMSIVGPRPVVPKFVEPYKNDYQEILKVKPGITDYATLYFTEEEELLRDKGGTPEEIEEFYIKHIHSQKIPLYKKYIREISFFTDAKLIFLTFFRLVKAIWKRLVVMSAAKYAYLPVDIIAISAGYFLSFFLRFDFDVPLRHRANILLGYPAAILTKLIAYLFYGRIYKAKWNPTMLSIVRIAQASLFAFLLWASTVLILRHSLYSSYPRGVMLIDLVVSTAMVIVMRTLFWNLLSRRKKEKLYRPRILITGNSEIFSARLLGFKPLEEKLEIAGLLSEKPQTIGEKFGDFKTMGTVAEVESISKEEGAEFLIAFPTEELPLYANKLLKAQNTRIVKKALVIPEIYLHTNFPKHLQSWVEPMNYGYLFRAPVAPTSKEINLIRSKIEGRAILVTGAAGSIGRELLKAVINFAPRKIILLDKDENSLHETYYEVLEKMSPEKHGTEAPELVPALMDASSPEFIKLIEETSPDIIFHAAANKHVDFSQRFKEAFIRNNILSTANLVSYKAQTQNKCKIVFLSTDKAVDPVSILGKTKRASEILVQSAGGITVRLVNVLDSNQSLTKIVHERVSRGAPLFLTDPEARRFYISLTEASYLMLLSVTIEEPVIVVPEDASELSVKEIVSYLLRTFSINYDSYPKQFTGLKEGEKKYESLYSPEEDKILEKRFDGKILLLEKTESLVKKAEKLLSYSPEKITEKLSQLFVD